MYAASDSLAPLGATEGAVPLACTVVLCRPAMLKLALVPAEPSGFVIASAACGAKQLPTFCTWKASCTVCAGSVAAGCAGVMVRMGRRSAVEADLSAGPYAFPAASVQESAAFAA